MQRPSFGHGLCCTSALSFYHGRICPGFSASIHLGPQPIRRSDHWIVHHQNATWSGLYHAVPRLKSYRTLWRIRDNGRLYSSDLIFRVHPALSPLINRYHAYLHQGRIVTLTEVKKDKDVLHVILSGASTSDMIFMTGGWV